MKSYSERQHYAQKKPLFCRSFGPPKLFFFIMDDFPRNCKADQLKLWENP